MTADSNSIVPSDMAQILVTPAAYADERLHDTYRWLRANMPLGQARPDGFAPFWVVSKHADILEVSRQNALFSNCARPSTLMTLEDEERVKSFNDGEPLIRTLVDMDAPDHMKYRGLTQRWFMPSQVKKMEESIRVTAANVVDRMAALGNRCDFVEEVALGYPLHVVMGILGVPEEDEPRMLKLTQDLFSSQDRDVSAEMAALTPEQLGIAFRMIVADYTQYFEAISAARRITPANDLATVIANATIDGKPIPVREAISYYIIAATAGHDTTSSSTAAAMWVLAENPDLLAQVKADPSLIPALVDEAIRWITPVKTFMRTATEDTELRGQKIAKGDWLMLCYASGNRDEEVFDQPFEFRLDRQPNKQLAFGYGAHMCLGQHLAKMEMRLLFEALLPRLKSVELDGPGKLSQSCFVSGPKTLPIRFGMA